MRRVTDFLAEFLHRFVLYTLWTALTVAAVLFWLLAGRAIAAIL